MDQPLISPAQRAVADAFERMFEMSRAQPAPDLAERLDRLSRLRALVQDNESRFETAISADFGHRSQVETAKPVLYRSPFNRLADLYPPSGTKIARLQKMLRFMS
jgi:hypothetical protein